MIMLKLALVVFMATKLEAQVFVPFSNWGCSNPLFLHDNEAALTQGTMVNTSWNGSALALNVGQTSGTYVTVPIDKGRCRTAPFVPFDKLSWTTNLPYGKELPANSELTADYSGLASSTLMNNIAGIWHFNGTGAIANAASIAAETGVAGTAFNANGTGLTYTTNAKLNSAITFDGVDDRIDFVGYTMTAVNDYTVSMWMRSNGTGNRVFVQNRGGGAGQSLTLSMGTNPGGCTATNGRVSFGLDSNGIYIGRCMSGGAINDNNWHHIVGVWDGTAGVAVAAAQFTIYVDGAAVAMTNRAVGTAPNAPLTGLGDTKIARHDAWNVFYVGSIDEVAIWHRPLSATEVQQLYRRGANRVKYRIRSCLSPTCFDNPTWMGYDGSSATFFSELNNNTLPAAMNGNVRTIPPVMDFSDFISLILPNSQYLQYEITMESDSLTLVPSVESVSVSY